MLAVRELNRWPHLEGRLSGAGGERGGLARADGPGAFKYRVPVEGDALKGKCEKRVRVQLTGPGPDRVGV